MGQNRKARKAEDAVNGLIDIGIGAEFPDSFLIREMKDYRKMSKAELLACIEELKSRHALRSKTQKKKAALAMHDREERLRAILDTAVEGIITINERGTVESINWAAEKIFGYKADEVIGKNVNMLMPSPHHQQHDTYLSNYRHTGHAKIIGIGREVSGRRKDGSVFPMDLAVSEVKLADRRLFTGFIRDITERKEAEKILKHQASIIESSDDAIIGKKLDGTITSWNKGAEKVFGYPRAEILGKNISLLIPADRSDEEPAIIQKLMRGESVDHYETIRRRKSGRLIDVSVTISPIRDEDEKIIGASKVARDITERKRLEKEILNISEREQRRIGYDLHDGLCQELAGIELMSQVLEQKLSRHSKSAAEKVGEIGRGVREAIGHTRSLARGLSPVTLESEGLMSALRELAANMEKLFNVRCEFECDLPVLINDPTTATNLFRIAQEAVSNAIKHGKAKIISIFLDSSRSHILMRVIDNGVGFPAKQSNKKGMGLGIMQSRAGMIGGRFAIERNAAGGVVIMCTVPKRAMSVKNEKSDVRQK